MDQLRRILGWRQPAQLFLWSLTIVLLSPGFGQDPSVSEGHEAMFVQTVVAQSSVERFHVGVLVRFDRVVGYCQESSCQYRQHGA